MALIGSRNIHVSIQNRETHIQEHSSTRGHSRKMRKLRSNTRIRQKEFSQRVVNLWNNLPSYVIESNSVNLFKSNLEKAWRNKFDCSNPDVVFS